MRRTGVCKEALEPKRIGLAAESDVDAGAPSYLPFAQRGCPSFVLAYKDCPRRRTDSRIRSRPRLSVPIDEVPMDKHDTVYKLLFSHDRMVRDLLDFV